MAITNLKLFGGSFNFTERVCDRYISGFPSMEVSVCGLRPSITHEDKTIRTVRGLCFYHISNHRSRIWASTSNVKYNRAIGLRPIIHAKAQFCEESK